MIEIVSNLVSVCGPAIRALMPEGVNMTLIVCDTSTGASSIATTACILCTIEHLNELVEISGLTHNDDGNVEEIPKSKVN